MPHIKSGMNLLDVGCGPGSITIGLAQAVAPGHVTGIDHDAAHIEAAQRLASDRGIANTTFQVEDALSLSFEDGTFDAAFENNVFVHLAKDAIGGSREIYRVLKPGAPFAARDVDTDAVVWGDSSDSLKELDRLINAWLENRGSDVRIGKKLPGILRQAGFINTFKTVSADTKGTPEAVRSHAEITLSLLDGPFGRDIIDEGWADQSTVDRLKETIRAWGRHPDAFFANVHVEVIGWKPA